jgi:acyl-CoA synthetase (AMP-forming)/AMP-acid ligase II
MPVLQVQRTLEPTRVGEVVIHGAAVTCSYWSDPEATARAIDSQGWLHTGDLGWFDNRGRLMLCGRLKDMIKSGGENVHASEIESALAVVTGVLEAAVVGVPHERFGEAVAALLCVHRGVADACDAGCTMPSSSATQSNTRPQVDTPTSVWEGVLREERIAEGRGHNKAVVLLDGDALTWLQGTLKQGGLSGFKAPKLVAVSQAPLPRTATGKVDKRAIKGTLQELVVSANVATGSYQHRSLL